MYFDCPGGRVSGQRTENKGSHPAVDAYEPTGDTNRGNSV